MNEIFYIFGSEDSQDYDILVLVDVLGTLEENKKTCLAFEAALLQQYGDKVLNVNIASIKNGQVDFTHKGTPDEVNNSVLATYGLHAQKHPLFITSPMIRDKGLKAIRSLRNILTFASRTENRIQIKEAMRGTATDKIEAVQQMDFSAINDLGQKKAIPITDFRKMCAFQMGQSAALNYGTELYTKSSIAEVFPVLAPFLARSNGDPKSLNEFRDFWIRGLKLIEIPEKETL